MLVITAANDRYLPGVKALKNTLKKHTPGAELTLMYQGVNPPDWVNVIQPSMPQPEIIPTVRREDTGDLHALRLLIPHIIDADRSLWLDADQLVIGDISPLFDIEFSEPVAATLSNSPLGKEIEGAVGRGFISSLLLFNHSAYIEEKILDRCMSVMREPDRKYYTGEQAVLNYVLGSRWHELPYYTQAHVGHSDAWPLRRETKLLHFLGTNPWEPIPKHIAPTAQKLKAREMWRISYCG